MTSPLFALAVSAVRAWTRVYTWRLDPLMRERRRAEVESDLWEFQQDTAGNRRVPPAVQVIARLVIGVPDDLGWRAEHFVVEASPARRVAAVAATAAALVVAALWVFASFQHAEMPRPPENPIAGWNPALMKRLPPLPPPPPPPPPPCQPPALTVGCR